MAVLSEIRKARLFKLLVVVGLSTIMFYAGQLTQLRLPVENTIEFTSGSKYEADSKGKILTTNSNDKSSSAADTTIPTENDDSLEEILIEEDSGPLIDTYPELDTRPESPTSNNSRDDSFKLNETAESNTLPSQGQQPLHILQDNTLHDQQTLIEEDSGPLNDTYTELDTISESPTSNNSRDDGEAAKPSTLPSQGQQSLHILQNYTLHDQRTMQGAIGETKASAGTTLVLNTTASGAKRLVLHITGSTAPKLVLFWTKFAHDEGSMWWSRTGGYSRTLRLCEYKNCRFTDDKSKIRDADMVLFKDNQMDFEGLTWPTYRTPKQLYVHYLGERPGKWHNYIKDYGQHINLTMNYRKNADISVPFQELYKRNRPIPGPYNLRIPLQNKTRMAVWPVSHCIADSKRQDYVKELSRYMDVDIYGRCGNYSCPKSDPYACYPQWERTYKFYLAFENAICDDYITEKYYKPLKYELVPVIMSGPRYTSETPPHDSIDIRDFSSPRHLAKHLHRLAQDEQEYSKYFNWKLKYNWGYSTPTAICKICKAAHVHTNRPARTDYYNYWFSGCDNQLVDRMRTSGNW